MYSSWSNLQPAQQATYDQQAAPRLAGQAAEYYPQRISSLAGPSRNNEDGTDRPPPPAPTGEPAPNLEQLYHHAARGVGYTANARTTGRDWPTDQARSYRVPPASSAERTYQSDHAPQVPPAGQGYLGVVRGHDGARREVPQAQPPAQVPALTGHKPPQGVVRTAQEATPPRRRPSDPRSPPYPSNSKLRSTDIQDVFKQRKNPKRFFVPGRVFATLWTEAAQERDNNQSHSSAQSWSVNTYGEPVFSKTRRFVVIRGGELAATVIPITTYGGQGLTKERICVEDHGLIRSDKNAAAPKDIPKGRAIQPTPIIVDHDSPTTKLDDLSRLNYGAPSTVHHWCKVKSIGMVNPGSMVVLLAQFYNVSMLPDKGLAVPVPWTTTNASGGTSTAQPDDIHALMARAVHDLVKAGWPTEKAVLIVQGTSAPPPGLAMELGTLRVTRDRTAE